jgi:hypothetical protein
MSIVGVLLILPCVVFAFIIVGMREGRPPSETSGKQLPAEGTQHSPEKCAQETNEQKQVQERAEAAVTYVTPRPRPADSDDEYSYTESLLYGMDIDWDSD